MNNHLKKSDGNWEKPNIRLFFFWSLGVFLVAVAILVVLIGIGSRQNAIIALEFNCKEFSKEQIIEMYGKKYFEECERIFAQEE